MCEVLDKFHFDARADADVCKTLCDKLLPPMCVRSNVFVVCCLRSLSVHVIRFALLENKDDAHGLGQSTHLAVVLALVRLLRALPDELQEGHMPRMLKTLCAALRSRDVTHRDIARATLCSTAVALGPEHFVAVVRAS